MNRPARLTALSLALALAACGGSPESEASAEAPALASTAVAMAEGERPTVLVFKTPTCGCCNGWVEHLEESGYTVETRDVRDLMSVKLDAGVPTPMSSCHTAIIDGYVVEGHVPASVVDQLLAERPDIAGIAVPGMPIGSPGMEGPNAKPYEVMSFDAEGNAAVYAEIDPR